ncbi:MAG: TolC family protein, partial [Nitrospira sp. SB0661_bin_20]|nr:TolC family protein [Nitrospira sp. SB0661_bin_20]
MKSLRIAVVVWLIGCHVSPAWAEEPAKQSSKETPRSILTLKEVLARVEQGHPLLQGSQTQKIVASGKLLKALGTFEPKLVNDWELERLAGSADTTTSVGFNDTFMEFRHPWGVQGFAGFRSGIGDVKVADLDINSSNQPLLGIVFPLLRGLITNPAHAELKKSELATRQAQLEIQQTRQDLYRGAAMQYWNWVAAHKFMELQEKAVTVAATRSRQLTRQAKAGARAEFDVIEANQEVQRRRAILIKARRTLEREQLKLALFMWEGD